MYRFRSEPDLLRLLNNRRNNKDCDGLRDEINHQPSNKSQHSLIINNRLRQHQQLIKSHQLDRKQSQQKFLSDSKSEGMVINLPLLNQDEKLNLLTCDNNSPDRPSDNQYNSTIKTKIRNSRLSLSDLSLTRGTQPVVSSSSTNQQRLNNLRLSLSDFHNYHWLRAFTISVLKNERNLTINSSRSSSSSISEAFHQLLPCSSTPVSNMLNNGISLIKSCSLKSHSRPLKQSVKSPVFMSTKSFNNSLDPLQSSQSQSSDIIRPGTSHASERNPTRAETFLSGSNLVLSPENLHNQHLLVSSSTLFLFLPIIKIQGNTY
ncbi:hypothetical protein PPACK8108_LOCUS9027 [Phakopsora pachyrhizi]|uniref:Uncharacterized protein n=1 Tax=Phakopsora pachyrhizi TaxID=170000 RepID=A0AAV0AXP3_PHAPC|nr:hypothetical protein PPACK8108_LOCUS9027 [Phakopsora pachyrhizi]